MIMDEIFCIIRTRLWLTRMGLHETFMFTESKW